MPLTTRRRVVTRMIFNLRSWTMRKSFLLLSLMSLFAISALAQNSNEDWGWLDSDQWKRVTRHYPDEVTFEQHSAHPEYRVIGSHVYTAEGKLVYTNSRLEYNFLTDVNTKDIAIQMKTDFMRALCLRDFDNDKYHFKSQNNVALVKEIINRLQPASFVVNPSNSNYYKEEKPCRYVNQLADDNRTMVENSTMLDTTRLGNNTIRYSIGYNDTIRYQTTFNFVDNGRYKVKKTIQSKLVNIPIIKPEVKPTVKEVTEVTVSDDNASKVFDVVEQMPSFKDGDSNMWQWVDQHLRYPAVALMNGVQGKVVVTFIIDKDGNVQSPTVTRSVDPSLDREALRLIKSMPKWNPGKQNGQVVNVRYSIPITFKLQ